MKEVPYVIGIDLGKSVFQVHAVDAGGRVVARGAAPAQRGDELP